MIEPGADDLVARARRSRPIARESENTLAVVDGPNMKPPGSAPSSRPSVRWTSATSASQASAAANWPWLLALLPLRCHAAGRLDRGVDDLRAGRAVEPRPSLVVAFGDGGEAMAQVEHADTVAHGSRRPHAAHSPTSSCSAAAGGASHEQNSAKCVLGAIVSGWAKPWRTIS